MLKLGTLLQEIEESTAIEIRDAIAAQKLTMKVLVAPPASKKFLIYKQGNLEMQFSTTAEVIDYLVGLVS